MTGSPLDEFHPAVRGVLRWFDCDHLPADLQAVAAPIRDVAFATARRLPSDPELTTDRKSVV